jgi:thiamine-monophosphate kinase
MPTEFEVIARYFTHGFPNRSDVILGVGDDAALCTVPVGKQLAISVDTLVGDVHFPLTTPPEDVGYKALAVNLSDMAAMGATPAWVTLALTCPEINTHWLNGFTRGFLELAKRAHVSLIGGDMTKGALTITVQVMGFVPVGKALQRNGAQVNDGIYVTGTLGDAGLGLASVLKRMTLPSWVKQVVEFRLHRPTPRLQEGQTLRGIAHSAIDISDGLLADLGHILDASGVGALIELEALPLSQALQQQLALEQAWQFALTAGDDYELCFTVPPEKEAQLPDLLPAGMFKRIGRIEQAQGIRCVDATGQLFEVELTGYQHF